jgi:prepilin-type N-terminal cleavage/methylation domain-containing protein
MKRIEQIGMKKFLENRLKGFTIVEIIVSMLISSTLVAVAIEIISSFLSVSALHNKNSLANDNILFSYASMHSAFINSGKIQLRNDNDLVFRFPNEDSINLSFKPGELIFSGQITDTIKISWGGLQVSKIDSSSQLVSVLELFIYSNGVNYPLYFKKTYTSQELLNE